MSGTATARANPNIAFIKYWGNRDDALRLPANSSLSMNLAGLYAQTRVAWQDIPADTLTLNGEPANDSALLRVQRHLNVIRDAIGLEAHAQVESENNFPIGAGITSSAAAFAALTLAACHAAGAALTERELTALARIGSGSASRSIPAGFVEWHVADNHADSFAESIASPDHWNLMDVIAVVSKDHKATGSQDGHRSAFTSDLQSARVAGAERRLSTCKRALLERDFATFASVVEEDSNLMHAIMMTSHPPLFYWQPTTLDIMLRVRQWREDGLQVCYTLDAGPNVHCICDAASAEAVRDALSGLAGVLDVRVAGPGGAAEIVSVI